LVVEALTGDPGVAELLRNDGLYEKIQRLGIE
jgi:hypothetical protein